MMLRPEKPVSHEQVPPPPWPNLQGPYPTPSTTHSKQIDTTRIASMIPPFRGPQSPSYSIRRLQRLQDTLHDVSLTHFHIR